MTNPLLEQHELPPFDRIEPAHMVPAIDQIIADNRAGIDQLIESGERNWDGFVHPLEELEDRLRQAWSPISHLKSVMSSDEIREAYNKGLSMLTEYQTELGQNRDLFDAYDQLKKSDDYYNLTAAQKKVIDNAIRDFRLSGVDLPEGDKARFRELSQRVAELSSKFNENVLDATMGWTKLITDKQELKGVPESTLSLLEQTAEQRGEEGWMLTLDYPCYVPVMTYCDNAELRKELYTAFTTRASDQGPDAGKWDNGPIMQEILEVRKEMAGLLGFANYAELSLATKMAEAPAQVMSFLDELAAKAKPVADSEFAELSEFARTEHGITELEPWDVGYYAEKLKQQCFEVSEEALRPWFPVPKVFAGMFEVVQRLYGIEIREADDMPVWHPDVTTWNVWRDGTQLARFYLDIYARTGKQGGAWMDECRVRRVTADGDLQLPVAYLTCNFSPPVGDTPSLLTHSEVVTLFHEFGHGLHHMLTQVDCADVSGINGV
ncbi:MAG: M3 family metallopeptidase, partial [Pseudomonadales bacterium]|nr:M3 family metallopeptidase [Pseudomonadales bacterium]